MLYIECSYCNSRVEQNVIWCRFCLRVLSQNHKRLCPVCAEPILKTDFRCRFCDAWVRDEPVRVQYVDRDDDIDNDGLTGLPANPPPGDGPPSLATAVVKRPVKP